MWSSSRAENVSNTCLDVWQKKKEKIKGKKREIKKRRKRRACVRLHSLFQFVISIVLYTFACVFMCTRWQFFLFPISRSLLYLCIFFFIVAHPLSISSDRRPSGAFVFLDIILYYYYYFRPANINYIKIYMCVRGLCVRMFVPLINQPPTGPHSISLCSGAQAQNG